MKAKANLTPSLMIESVGMVVEASATKTASARRKKIKLSSKTLVEIRGMYLTYVAEPPSSVDIVCITFKFRTINVKEQISRPEMIHRQTLDSSVADPDPGSGAFLPPGSGIRDGAMVGSGSGIRDK
jgi:hypothetical protein